MLHHRDARTIEAAKACRCPFGVAEFCVAASCMSWKTFEVETDWKDAVSANSGVEARKASGVPSLDEADGSGWRLCFRSDRHVWVRFVDGGDCRRLKQKQYAIYNGPPSPVL